jgi:hypothetical protein
VLSRVFFHGRLPRAGYHDFQAPDIPVPGSSKRSAAFGDNGVLTDSASSYGVEGHYTGGDDYTYGHTIGSCWGDVDNDGDFDLFVGNFRHNWGNGTQDYAAFYSNDGSGGSWNFTKEWQLDSSDWQESYASPVLGDYDNDGDLDLFITTVYEGDNARLYRNDDDANFVFSDQTSTEGLNGMGDTTQAAFADVDEDGRSGPGNRR